MEPPWDPSELEPKGTTDYPAASCVTRQLSPQNCALALQVRCQLKSKTRGAGRNPGLRVLQKVVGSSGRLRRFSDVFRLGAFLPLDYFKFNVIALLQAFVAFRLDGAVVDKHIGAVFPTNEAESLCVVEPFHFALNSRHVPYSERPPANAATGPCRGPI